MSSDIEDCIPDSPDVQSEVNKAIASAKGKVPDLQFSGFDIDVSKYFDFNMFGKLLGRDGLGMDVCDHCINGTAFDDMDGGALIPAQETIDGINQGINDNAQNIANNANQGGGTP